MTILEAAHLEAPPSSLVSNRGGLKEIAIVIVISRLNFQGRPLCHSGMKNNAIIIERKAATKCMIMSGGASSFPFDINTIAAKSAMAEGALCELISGRRKRRFR